MFHSTARAFYINSFAESCFRQCVCRLVQFCTTCTECLSTGVVRLGFRRECGAHEIPVIRPNPRWPSHLEKAQYSKVPRIFLFFAACSKRGGMSPGEPLRKHQSTVLLRHLSGICVGQVSACVSRICASVPAG